MNILIVAAHCDDESFMGGTIARHVAEGDTVYLMTLSRGVASRFGGNALGREFAQIERMNALERAVGVLGFTDYRQANEPDQRLDQVALLDIAKHVEFMLENFNPHTVYTHSYADLNQDHRRVHEATLIACRPHSSNVKAIYAYEVPSSTEWGLRPFRPNHFVDIGDYEQTKLEALSCYESELRDFPHPRSMEAICARHRYWGSVAGVECAEAFETVREVC